MTFGPQHYVPVLKVKRGEKAALRAISPTLRPRITPLLEIVERTKPTVTEHLDTAFKGLADSIGPYARCFLDTGEIAPDGPLAAAEVFDRATADGIVFTPITGITRSADIAAALNHRVHGLALRLTRQEFESGRLPSALPSFMTLNGLTPRETDLIIDLGPVDSLVTPGVIGLTNAFLADVPDPTRWRTLTVSACSFPPSMGGVRRNSYDFVERGDWMAWRDNLHARRNELLRLPTYSDGAIQNPTGVEDFDFRVMQVSASIRYTSLDEWLLIKGESTRIILPSTQFPSLATQLAYGHLSGQYRGRNHCEGCAMIRESADGVPGLGSAEAWRRIGTIHHITTVVQDVESLSWP